MMGSIIGLFNDVISPHKDTQLFFIEHTLIAINNSFIVVMSENID